MKADLVEMIRSIAAKYPHKICLQSWHNDHIKERLSFKELIEQAEAKAKRLRDIGMQAGDRVAIIDHNSLDWVVAFFAILFCKGTVVAVDARLDGADMARFSEGIDVQMALIRPSLFMQIPESERNRLGCFYNLEKDYEPFGRGQINPNKDGDPSIALICFTSGSTGVPKGILLDHQALLATTQSAWQIGIRSEDRFLAILPLSHVIGVCTSMLSSLNRGCEVTFINELNSENILRALQATKTTVFILVPRLLDIFYLKILEKVNAAGSKKKKIFDAMLSVSRFCQKYLRWNVGKFLFSKVHDHFGGHLRLFLSGGAALEPKSWQGMHDLGFGVLNGYGLSETASAFTSTRLKGAFSMTAGNPFQGIQVKIEPETKEICVKGPNVFKGYFRNEDLSKEVLQDGWFHTGDLGYLTKKGELVVSGRLKELIVLQSGQKALPNEVDRYYAEIEGVEDFASFGVPAFLGSTTEIICAAVVAANKLELDDQKKIEQRVQERGFSIPTHLRVSRVYFVEAIPRSAALKIKRFELRKQFSVFQEQPAQINEEKVETELLKQLDLAPEKSKISLIKNYVEGHVRRLLNLPSHTKLDDTKGFFELGLDSLLATELVTKLQEGFGAKNLISTTAAFEYPNITAITNYLKSLLKISSFDTTTAVKKAPSTKLAIVGMSCRFPGADSIAAFWELLKKGQCAISEVPKERFDVDQYFSKAPAPGKMYCRKGGFLKTAVDQFDAHFFGITPKEAEMMDPQQRLLLEVVFEALEDAWIAPDSLAKTKTGVFIGACSNNYGDLLSQRADLEDLSAYAATGNAASVLAGRISYFLGTEGPCVTMDTACSSSLVAFHSACQSLLHSESDMALVGGVNLILSPSSSILFCQAKMLSEDGLCKTFDENANGYTRAEGCGVVVLKRLEEAIQNQDRIIAVVEASAINQDGASSGLTVPNGESQAALIAESLKRAQIQGAQIDYVEAHGTGTSLGDPIEIRALGSILGRGRSAQHPLMIGSLKTNIGHLEGAAGIASIIKVALSLSHEEIPAHLHLKKINPLISLDLIPAVIPTELTSWKRNSTRRRFAGVSSFGFSGTNAHAILSEPPILEKKRNPVDRPLHILSLSAKSEPALDALLEKYKTVEGDLADIAFSANTGRSHFANRACLVASSKEQMIKILNEKKYKKSSVSGTKKIAFLFTGQGAQYIGMGKDLYETQTVFKESIDNCAQILKPLLKKSLTSLLFEEQEALHQTMYTQPALFALEYSLASLWKSFGIEPDYVMGHSVGEYVAATIAGKISLEDGLKLICARSRLMQKLPIGGGMLAVFADLTQIPKEVELDIAAINGPKQIVLSGNLKEIKRAKEIFEKQGVWSQQLTVSHAFHSHLMEPMLKEFESEIKSIAYHPLQTNLVSNVTGELANEETINTQYWLKHVRCPVLFDAGLKTLQKENCNIFIEIGPQSTLLGMAKSTFSTPEMSYLPSLSKQSSWIPLLESLSQLYLAGINIDWKGFDAPYARQKVSLPFYPFQRQRYWADAIFSRKKFRKKDLSFLGEPIFLPNQDTHYTQELSHLASTYLKDHRILGQFVFPASGYVEMMLLAAKKKYNTEQLVLENFKIGQILDLSSDAMLTMTSSTKDGLQVQVFSQKKGQKDWNEHSSSILRSQSIGKETLWQDTYQEKIEPALFYDTLKEQGFEYGPHFRLLTGIQKGDAKASAQIKTELVIQDSSFHPALLDAALQLLAVSLFDKKVDTEAIYLPLRIDRLVILQQVESEVVANARVEMNGDLIKMDLQIVSKEGFLVASIQGFQVKKTAKSLLRKVLGKEEGVEKLLYKPIWEPKACVGPHEGIKKVFLYASARVKEAIQASGVEVIEEISRAEEIVYVVESLDVKKETTQILSLLQKNHPQRLWVLSFGVQTGDLSSLIGMLRSVQLERQQPLVHIDFDVNVSLKENMELFKEELLDVEEREILYVLKKRFVRRLLPLDEARKEEGKLVLPKGSSYQLQIEQKGFLNNLSLQPIQIPSLEKNQVAIKVQATGLNFRDVLNALGLYPGEAGLLGGECSGIITAVGSGVKNFKVGDEVLGFATGSFASDVVSYEHLMTLKPKSITFSEAAALPIVFLTAQYSLISLANLRPHQKVLIHAASGGVGLAAIQIAKQQGAEIFATVGSKVKKEHLLGLGVTHIYDSRSLTFAEEILRDTGGQGVDVVLNSLSGTGFIEKTVSVCARGATFLEIGKRNIWSSEEMKKVRPDLSYFVIALDDMLVHEQQVIHKLLQEVIPQFSNNDLKPLPVTSFSLTHAIHAFQYMQQAKHIGKVVIEREKETAQIEKEAAYLITGGGGALGLEMAKWLVSKGAQHIFLVGRRLPNVDLPGVYPAQLDVSVEKDVHSFIRRFGADLPPLKGVFHAAGILDDGVIQEQNWERFEKVLGPKAYGAWYLHKATEHLSLDFFVLFSSIASILGSPGQINYAAANSSLDALALWRKQKNLAALSINWGPWKEVGMAAGLEARHKAAGFIPLKAKTAIEALELALDSQSANVMIVDANWSQFQSRLPEPLPILSKLIANKTQGLFHLKLQTQLELVKEEEKPKLIEAHVEELVRHTIGLKHGASLDKGQNFYQLGLDSLMAVELTTHIQSSIGPTWHLKNTLIMDYPTIELLSKYLKSLLLKDMDPSSKSTFTGKALIHIEKGQKNMDLICFPHAGGGPWLFSKWSEHLDCNLSLVQPPGRGARHLEAPMQDLKELVAQIIEEIPQDRPYAFFGHSMGAVLCYEVAKELKRLQRKAPTALFVASLDAPISSSFKKPKEHILPILQVEHAQTYKSDPEVQKLMQTFLSSIESDLDLLDRYESLNTETLQCPIFLFSGVEDGVCSESGLNAWQNLTTSTFKRFSMPGNHFDLLANAGPMLSEINRSLA
jgi:acyl transferase domain-containing protein/long-subunit acyl-CoA synthetase (AMP-forming)/NADPH:quinone reductase-like Zn-dependent oxidoreductase/surfactin synthase thioesterase subunit